MLHFSVPAALTRTMRITCSCSTDLHVCSSSMSSFAFLFFPLQLTCVYLYASELQRAFTVAVPLDALDKNVRPPPPQPSHNTLAEALSIPRLLRRSRDHRGSSPVPSAGLDLDDGSNRRGSTDTCPSSVGARHSIGPASNGGGGGMGMRGSRSRGSCDALDLLSSSAQSSHDYAAVSSSYQAAPLQRRCTHCLTFSAHPAPLSLCTSGCSLHIIGLLNGSYRRCCWPGFTLAINGRYFRADEMICESAVMRCCLTSDVFYGMGSV